MPVPPRPDTNPSRLPRRPPPTLRSYRVVLHHAGDYGLLAVVQTLRDLTRFGEEEALVRMWEAYHRGRAVVLTTHLERAELYVEQFAARGLSATVEPG